MLRKPPRLSSLSTSSSTLMNVVARSDTVPGKCWPPPLPGLLRYPNGHERPDDEITDPARLAEHPLGQHPVSADRQVAAVLLGGADGYHDRHVAPVRRRRSPPMSCPDRPAGRCVHSNSLPVTAFAAARVGRFVEFFRLLSGNRVEPSRLGFVGHGRLRTRRPFLGSRPCRQARGRSAPLRQEILRLLGGQRDAGEHDHHKRRHRPQAASCTAGARSGMDRRLQKRRHADAEVHRGDHGAGKMIRKLSAEVNTSTRGGHRQAQDAGAGRHGTC